MSLSYDNVFRRRLLLGPHFFRQQSTVTPLSRPFPLRGWLPSLGFPNRRPYLNTATTTTFRTPKTSRPQNRTLSLSTLQILLPIPSHSLPPPSPPPLPGPASAETPADGVSGDPAEQPGSATQTEAERENAVPAETDAVGQENGPRHASGGSLQIREVPSGAVPRAPVHALPVLLFRAFPPPKRRRICGSGEAEPLPTPPGSG